MSDEEPMDPTPLGKRFEWTETGEWIEEWEELVANRPWDEVVELSSEASVEEEAVTGSSGDDAAAGHDNCIIA